jgi:NadR type nicotinamide-nucleotide adenylyltransferase
MTHKVVIIGPESTGKSTLSQQLAGHLNMPWIPEYARYYLEKLVRNYRYKDLLNIAVGQINWENEALEKNTKLLICDTDLLVIKVWSEHKYGKLDPWVERQIQNRTYDHYFLTQVDFPWQPDPLREHPDKREYFFGVYQNLLENLNKPYHIISGSPQERLSQCLNHLTELGFV